MMINRRAPVAKEEQDHQSDEGSSKDRLPEHTENGSLDENRLVTHGMHNDAGGQGLLDPRQQPLDAIDDVESRYGAGLENRHQHGFGAVDAHHIGLRRGALVYEGYIADVDHCTVDRLHRKAVNLVEDDRTGVERDIPIIRADFLVPCRQNKVLRGNGVDDILGRYIVLLHRALVNVDLRLKDFSTVR